MEMEMQEVVEEQEEIQPSSNFQSSLQEEEPAKDRKPRTLKSQWWNFFIKRDNYGVCKICNTSVKTCGNTTNLRIHYIAKHTNRPKNARKKESKVGGRRRKVMKADVCRHNKFNGICAWKCGASQRINAADLLGAQEVYIGDGNYVQNSDGTYSYPVEVMVGNQNEDDQFNSTLQQTGSPGKRLVIQRKGNALERTISGAIKEAIQKTTDPNDSFCSYTESKLRFLFKNLDRKTGNTLRRKLYDVLEEYEEMVTPPEEVEKETEKETPERAEGNEGVKKDLAEQLEFPQEAKETPQPGVYYQLVTKTMPHEQGNYYQRVDRNDSAGHSFSM